LATTLDRLCAVFLYNKEVGSQAYTATTLLLSRAVLSLITWNIRFHWNVTVFHVLKCACSYGSTTARVCASLIVVHWNFDTGF